MYRLSLSQYSRQFVLKGALMFKAWGMANFRPTRDVDLLGHALNTLEHIKALFEDICKLDAGLMVLNLIKMSPSKGSKRMSNMKASV
ncbi:MAG: nucleotidyl transferase AbiEii/AbiGii toxin family protein [Chloroflexi bacterium]|nr:nucleotidyl transferase AbiEii/AbiGii toxin family protein [Chloroflexota bacterium]